MSKQQKEGVWLLSGTTLYVLNEHGFNLWFATFYGPANSDVATEAAKLAQRAPDMLKEVAALTAQLAEAQEKAARLESNWSYAKERVEASLSHHWREARDERLSRGECGIVSHWCAAIRNMREATVAADKKAREAQEHLASAGRAVAEGLEREAALEAENEAAEARCSYSACACMYERVDAVCQVHSPAVAAIQAKLDAALTDSRDLRNCLMGGRRADCADCGPAIRVDEDGCCVACGRDADIVDFSAARDAAVGALRRFVADFETDFVMDGGIVDCPETRWSPLVENYRRAQAALAALPRAGTEVHQPWPVETPAPSPRLKPIEQVFGVPREILETPPQAVTATEVREPATFKCSICPGTHPVDAMSGDGRSTVRYWWPNGNRNGPMHWSFEVNEPLAPPARMPSTGINAWKPTAAEYVKGVDAAPPARMEGGDA